MQMQMEIFFLVGYFVIGGIGGFLGATVGGGGLLMIPFLMFTGLSAPVAIASARFGDIGFAVTASYKYWRSNQILWKYVPLLAVLSLAGSLIGANILLSIDPGDLRKVAAVLLLILLPFVLFKKDIGVEHREVGRVRKAITAFIFFVIEVVTGFFAAGTGPLVYYTLMAGFRITITEAVATQMLPFLILTVSSTIVFAMHGLVDYTAGILLFAGTAAGGYIGAHMAVVKGAAWLKGLFAIVIVAAAIKLLFF